MIDFPLDGLMAQEACLAWLEKYLHPQGLKCPKCGSAERRVDKQGGHFPAYRCKACDRYHTLLSGTVLAKTRQTPSTLVMILRGISKGETTARLSRELGISRKQMTVIRQRLQANVERSLPDGPMADNAVFEADELYQNAGEKKPQARRPCRPAAPTRQQAQGAGHL